MHMHAHLSRIRSEKIVYACILIPTICCKDTTSSNVHSMFNIHVTRNTCIHTHAHLSRVHSEQIVDARVLISAVRFEHGSHNFFIDVWEHFLHSCHVLVSEGRPYWLIWNSWTRLLCHACGLLDSYCAYKVSRTELSVCFMQIQNRCLTSFSLYVDSIGDASQTNLQQ